MRGRDFVAFLKESLPQAATSFAFAKRRSAPKNFNEGKANFVGDDILGVPSIKISFCLKGPSRTPVPTGYGENFDILIVGEDIILPCLTIKPVGDDVLGVPRKACLR